MTDQAARAGGTALLVADAVSDWLTIEEAAPLLGVSVRTIGRLCAAGLIPAMKVLTTWRIWRDFVESVRQAVAAGASVDLADFAQQWKAAA